MPRLSVSLLGTFHATLNEEPISGFESAKVRALLAYLMVEAASSHRRERLAGLLWPDRPDRAAHNNLRHALSILRQAVGDRPVTGDPSTPSTGREEPLFLLITRETVQFNRASDYWLDVERFGTLVDADLPGLADAQDQVACRQLAQAVALYRGGFLDGFSVKGSPAFEEWSLLVRDRLQRQASTALRRLVSAYEARGEMDQACRYARCQVELEPWHEEAHQRLMRLLALNGQRSAALVQYEACRQALRDELDVEPGEETTRLYERIRDGELVPATAPSVASTLPAAESSLSQGGSSPSRAATGRAAGLRGERRRVTALLVLVTGLTARGDPVDAETRAEVMNRVCHIVGDEIERYGGEIDRYRDDGLITLFGASAAHEDDPERAVRAALGIQEAVQLYAAELAEGQGMALSLRVGINTGQVIAAQLETRVQYWEVSATERALALAARPEATSEPVDILVAEDTWRLVAPLFEWARVDRTDPGSIAYRPLAPCLRTDKGRGIEGLASPLVGRGAELQLLKEAVARLQQGIGGIVTLVGEAGIGKSRLVAETRQCSTSADLAWIEGRCLSYATNVAYQLWLDVLHALLARLDGSPDASPTAARDVLEEWVRALCPDDADRVYPYLAQMMSLPLQETVRAAVRGLDAESLQFVTFRAAEAVLERAAQTSPLVVVCEDLHWVDPTSLALLVHLLPLVDRVPLLFVCVFRPEMEHRCWALRERATRHYPHRHSDLWLKPLTMADSATLVGNLLYVEDLPPGLRERILEHAGGNPFYVEEILHAMIDNGSLVHDEASGRWQTARDVVEIPIPDTLRGVIASRIDHLPGEAKHLLQMASVIGRIFTYPVLSSIAARSPLPPGEGPGVRALDALLLTLQRTQLIRERARRPVREYAFKHVLTQEAAYSSLLGRDRRGYHRRVAAALERLYPERIEEQLGLLAHHWEQAGESEQAVDYLRRAGEHAAAQFANQEAIDTLGRALALIPESDLAGRYALLLAREGVYDVQGVRESQRQDLAALERVAKALGDSGRRAQVALRKAQYAFAVHDHSASIAAAQEAVSLAQAAGDVACEAAAYLQWGITLRRVNRYAAATHVLERALALTRSASLREMETEALRALGFTLGFKGEYALGRSYLEQSLDMCRQIASPKTEGHVLATLSMTLVHAGDYDAVRTHAERALRIFREIGFRWGQGNALWSLSFVSLRQGDYPRAKVFLDQQLQNGRETGNPGRESRALADLGLLVHCLGDHESAYAYSLRGVQVAQDCGNRYYECYALIVLGHALAGLGQFVEAVDTYLTALNLYRRQNMSYWTADLLAGLARIALVHEQFEEALAYVEEILCHVSTYPQLQYVWEPLRVCLTCYHVLCAVEDARAEEVLHAAYRLLQKRAGMIKDQALRRSYLENVSYHREIVAAWERKGVTSLGR